MTHIGALCPPSSSHVNTIAALGRELQRRGHRVTLFGITDIESKVLAEGLEFWLIGQSDFPPGSLTEFLTQIGKLTGLAATLYWHEKDRRMAATICRDAPGAMKEAGVEVLLVDQMEPAGGSVAELLGIPFITVCSALDINWEPSLPPTYTPWSYRKAWWAYLRNWMGFYASKRTVKPIQAVINEYRRQWKLPVQTSPSGLFASSQFAQISQQPAAFDFPRTTLPKCFHYTGPFRKSSRQTIPFPYEKLTGQPLIYASLGTLQNRRQEIFHSIAAACEGLDAQLVVSLGGGSSVEEYQGLPGAPLVVEYAPQLELLTKARLTITHAGLNTVLESLSQAVPMVAIPITHDQPGVGARLLWTGAGEVVPLNRLSVSRLKAAVQRVLTEDSYSDRASKLRESIQQAGGVVRAADIVEQAIATGGPVLSSQRV